MALRALYLAHEFFDGVPGILAVRFGVAALQVGCDTFEIGIELTSALLFRALYQYLLAVGTVHYLVYRFIGQLGHRLIDRESVLFGEGVDIHCGYGAFGIIPAGSLYGAVPDGKSCVWHDEVGVYPK